MRSANRSALRILPSFVALSLVLSGAWLLYPALRARYLAQELNTLQLGISTFDDAQRLAAKIDAKVTPFGPCTRSSCELEKRIDNSSLPRWWRGSGVAFVVSFHVKDGILVEKNTGFGIGQNGSWSLSSVGLEEQQNWGQENTRVPVQAGWYTAELSRYYLFQVRMTPNASPEDRRRYTAYNYSCFWKYKGCRDARDLLPSAASLEP